MKPAAMVRKIAQIVSGTALMVATTFWAVLVVRLASGFAAGGMDGARGNLHRVILGATFWAQIGKDPVTALSRGYEGLLLFLLFTWALRELYAALSCVPLARK